MKQSIFPSPLLTRRRQEDILSILLPFFPRFGDPESRLMKLSITQKLDSCFSAALVRLFEKILSSLHDLLLSSSIFQELISQRTMQKEDMRGLLLAQSILECVYPILLKAPNRCQKQGTMQTGNYTVLCNRDCIYKYQIMKKQVEVCV